MSIDRYNQIVKLDSDYNFQSPTPHIPKPTSSDYEDGYVVRYFVQKSNDVDSRIIEVNSKTFTNYTQNLFFTSVSLDWAISGDVSVVREQNKKSILYASKTMKAIPLYLQNPIQFLKK